MALTWDALQQSDFFDWFHITEVGRTPANGGGTEVHCKPGGFQDDLDLIFGVDAGNAVQQAMLSVNRTWMDDARGAPFAADITKSFLLVFCGDDPVLRDFPRQLEQLVPQLPGVISRADAMTAPSFSGPAQDALAIYRGYGQEARIDGERAAVILTSVTEPRPALQVVWIADRTAGIVVPSPAPP